MGHNKPSNFTSWIHTAPYTNTAPGNNRLIRTNPKTPFHCSPQQEHISLDSSNCIWWRVHIPQRHPGTRGWRTYQWDAPVSRNILPSHANSIWTEVGVLKKLRICHGIFAKSSGVTLPDKVPSCGIRKALKGLFPLRPSPRNSGHENERMNILSVRRNLLRWIDVHQTCFSHMFCKIQDFNSV